MKQVKILFVCLGNICRSPMAEEVFRQYASNHLRDTITDTGDELDIVIDSAGIGNWHSGQLPDSRMRKAAKQHGYELTMRARQVKPCDFEQFNYIVAMDEENVHDLQRVSQRSELPFQQANKKILRMADFLRHHPGQHTIPDPYYGGEHDFHFVIELLEDAVEALWNHIIHQTKC